MELIKNYNYAVSAIRAELKHYIIKQGLKSLVLGISGGIDSALVAALAKPICDELGIPLIGRSITIETNKPDEIARAKEIGEAFCTDFKEIYLTNEYFTIRNMVEFTNETKTAPVIDRVESDIERKIRLGNIKARMRMIYLYNLSQQNKGLVLSTDNLTEYLLGFWTIAGDIGDYGMIQKMWKTEVYEMSRHLCTEEYAFDAAYALTACVSAIPTDGLGITSSDLEQIGAKTYEEVDVVLDTYLTTGEILNEKVVERHVKSAFKRNHPLNLEREIYFEKKEYIVINSSHRGAFPYPYNTNNNL